MTRRSWPYRVLIATTLFSIILIAGMRSDARGPSTSTWLLVGLGDSLTHGTMDAHVNMLSTSNAYLNQTAGLLAQSVTLLFSQPFLNDNEARVVPFQIPTNVGIDGEDSFSIDGLEYYKRAGEAQSLFSSEYTADKFLPSQFDDLHDAVLYPLNVFAWKPVTQMQSAEWLLKNFPTDRPKSPTIVVYWVGNNDSSTAALGFGGSNPTTIPLPPEQLKPVLPDIAGLLQWAESQGQLSTQPYTAAMVDRNLTLLTDFATQQATLINRLVNASNGKEKHIFVLTLPYYSSIGYLMDSDDLEYYFRKVNPAYSVPPSFKRVNDPGQAIKNPLQGDRISLLTFGLMYALLGTGYSPAFVNEFLEVNGQQRDGLVLSEAEQQQIRDRIDGFNSVLRTLANSSGPNVHLVDIGNYLNQILTGQAQLVIRGKKISRKWIRGSAFSFDGVHPGYTGQAAIANYLIEDINRALGMNAPLASLENIIQTDPYIDRDNDGWAAGPNYTASGLNSLLFLFKDPDDTDAHIQVSLAPNVWRVIAQVLIKEIVERSRVVKTEAERRGLLLRQ